MFLVMVNNSTNNNKWISLFTSLDNRRIGDNSNLLLQNIFSSTDIPQGINCGHFTEPSTGLMLQPNLNGWSFTSRQAWLLNANIAVNTMVSMTHQIGTVHRAASGNGIPHPCSCVSLEHSFILMCCYRHLKDTRQVAYRKLFCHLWFCFFRTWKDKISLKNI